MSKHTITCVLVNSTTGTMVLAGTDPNSGTDLDMTSGSNALAPGTSTEIFTGSNSTASGCGGTVTYTMPNNIDIMVIAYNTSVGQDNTFCFPMLRSNNTNDAIACDAYYCDTVDSVSTTEDNGITTWIMSLAWRSSAYLADRMRKGGIA